MEEDVPQMIYRMIGNVHYISIVSWKRVCQCENPTVNTAHSSTARAFLSWLDALLPDAASEVLLNSPHQMLEIPFIA